jgi:hypothetical protein
MRAILTIAVIGVLAWLSFQLLGRAPSYIARIDPPATQSLVTDPPSSPLGPAQIAKVASVTTIPEKPVPSLAERQAAITKQIANDSQSRVDYAAAAEIRYLKDSMDVTVRASGAKKTTLTLTYVLMGRPTVFNMVNDANFVSIINGLGFKTVIFSDGFNSSWRYGISDSGLTQK